MQILIILMGIIAFGMSVICELYFHLVQKFQKGKVCNDNDATFWRAEKAQLANTFSFFILGGILITIGIILP
jgi:hypothetical protein